MQLAMLKLRESWSRFCPISIHRSLDQLPFQIPGVPHRAYYFERSFHFCAPRMYKEILWPKEDVDELDPASSLSTDQL